jgi:putative tryptophan/tyrosine transport system substrate-binding protein
MNRRGAVLALLVLGAAPRSTFAQPSGKVRRVGFFFYGSRQSALDSGRYEAFVQGMRELGYVVGQNLMLEERYVDGNAKRLPILAAELVKLNVEVIVATGTPTYRVLRQASPVIPVVITVSPDPVRDGWATTMAQPGGQFTGLSSSAADPGPKQLELLMAAIPKLSRIAVLLHPANPGHPPQLVKIMSAAQNVGIQTIVAQADTVQGIGREFELLAKERAQAVIIPNDTFFFDHLSDIAAQALKHRMPSIGAIYEYVNVGGLMFYGPDLVDNFRRAPLWVDKILKGASAGQLPIEQPSKYSFLINLKTAKALGIAVPQALRLRADRVIE